MKIYTRTGDDGSTGLIGGTRVRKCDKRLECYGTIDELNAALGLAVVGAPSPQRTMIEAVQSDLFTIGALLAAPDPASAERAGLTPMEAASVDRLEHQIDDAEDQLPPLANFILPGGSELAARLHVARTICRRAERLLTDFALDRPVPPMLLTYLNRLSDWLFVQARVANQVAGVADVVWIGR